MRITPVLAALAACTLSLTACSVGTPGSATPSPTPSASPSTGTPTASPPSDTATSTSPAPSSTAAGGEGGAGAPPAPAPGLAVELTYAGLPAGGSGYEAAGLVPDVVEDGGTCTFRFVSGNDVVEEVTTGVADASSTSCGRAEVAVPRLGAGTWQVTLGYRGPSGSGTSPVVEMVVP